MFRFRPERAANFAIAASPIVVLSILAASLLIATPAEGSPSKANLQAEASSLSSAIAAQSIQLHQNALAGAQANYQLTTAQVHLAAIQRSLASDGLQVTNAKHVLAEIALDEFTNGSTSNSVIAMLTSSQGELVARIEYERVLGLDTGTAIMNYTVALAHQQSELKAAQIAEAQAQAAQGKIMAAAAAIQSDISREQASLASLNGQIAALVQAQLAAELARKAVASQGLPSASGLVSVARSQAGVGNWGGVPAPPSPAAFAALRDCESSGNYADNTGNGYYGAYQFALSTWLGLGFTGLPSNAAPSTQDQAAQIEQRRAGWYAWPECSLVLGLI